MHFGWAEACDFPKCGKLEREIFVRGDPRSRGPQTQRNQRKIKVHPQVAVLQTGTGTGQPTNPAFRGRSYVVSNVPCPRTTQQDHRTTLVLQPSRTRSRREKRTGKRTELQYFKLNPNNQRYSYVKYSIGKRAELIRYKYQQCVMQIITITSRFVGNTTSMNSTLI